MTGVSQLERISISAEELVPLPATAERILRLLGRPQVSSIELESIISQDPSFAMRVLRIANSSFYGCRRQVANLRSAVTLLGHQQVQKIASALLLAPAFESDTGPGLWRHSIHVALWTERVLKQLGLPQLEHLFLAGLTHDIGFILLLRGAPEEETDCLEMARTTGWAVHDVERDRLGTDHAEAGAMVCRAWNLPDRMGELIAAHHREGDGRPAVDRSVLALSEYLARVTGVGEFEWMEPPTEPCAAATELGLRDADFERLLDEAEIVQSQCDALGAG